MASPDKRFGGLLSEEYRLVERAYPHFHLLQEAVGNAVAGYRARTGGGQLDILELGCGDGITSDTILRAREGTRLTAVDHEEKMTALARTNLSAWDGAGRLNLVTADALAFLRGSSEAAFDIAASALTLHNLERPYRHEVLPEIFRVLKPGGLFVNADKYAPDGQARFEALHEQLERFFEAFLPIEKYELLKEWVVHNVDDQSPNRMMPADEAIRRMQDIGFVEVTLSERHNMEAVLTARKP